MRTFESDQQPGVSAIEAALRHPKSQGLSDTAIAKHVGVSQPSVSAWRTKLSQKLYEMEAPAARTVTRNGTTYQQNTANIGKRKSEPDWAQTRYQREAEHIEEPQAPVFIPPHLALRQAIERRAKAHLRFLPNSWSTGAV